jgi:hypothetical protein
MNTNIKSLGYLTYGNGEKIYDCVAIRAPDIQL